MAQHPPPPPLVPWVVHTYAAADGIYVPLVTEPNYHSIEFQPQCFNPKQYKRVLKRRMARAKIEEMRIRRQAAAACKGSVANISIAASDIETTSAADSGSNVSTTNNNETPCVAPAVALSIDSSTTAATMISTTTTNTTTAAAASRRAFKYISRHRHAKKRPRGPDGRYLKKEQLADYYKLHPDEDPSVSDTI
jgi:hypothetical protein